MVGHCPRQSYIEVCGVNNLASLNHSIANLNVGWVAFDADPSIVEFLAVWIHTRDSRKALDTSKPDGLTWLVFFCQALKFCMELKMHDELHDSLVSSLIGYMKLESMVVQGQKPGEIVNALFGSVASIETFSLTTMKNSKIVELLAILTFYQDGESLTNHRRAFQTESATLANDVRDCALNFLIDEHLNGICLPDDPLDVKFNEYCRYHLHEVDDAGCPDS